MRDRRSNRQTGFGFFNRSQRANAAKPNDFLQILKPFCDPETYVCRARNQGCIRMTFQQKGKRCLTSRRGEEGVIIANKDIFTRFKIGKLRKRCTFTRVELIRKRRDTAV